MPGKVHVVVQWSPDAKTACGRAASLTDWVGSWKMLLDMPPNWSCGGCVRRCPGDVFTTWLIENRFGG